MSIPRRRQKRSLPGPAIHRFSRSNEMKHNQLNCARSRARGWRDQLSRREEEKIPFDESWRRSVERAPRQSRKRRRACVRAIDKRRFFLETSLNFDRNFWQPFKSASIASSFSRCQRRRRRRRRSKSSVGRFLKSQSPGNTPGHFNMETVSHMET